VDASRAPGRLAGKVVVVVGATGVVGEACARRFAAEGARLVLAARSSERLEALAASVAAAGHPEPAIVTVDLADGPVAAGAAERMWAAFGAVDVVVVTAVPPADERRSGTVMSTPDELWLKHFDVVVRGPLALLRVLLPKMAAAGGGSVVLFGTNDALKPTPGVDAYGVAKAALMALGRYLAKEWGPDSVRVNTIVPGSILTDPADEPARRRVAEANGVFVAMSVPRFGAPDEVVGAVLFLASDESTFVTGAELHVDGGRF
jgi:meso-butanediol dehydrogenase / (S,S)-butanediol dehydrogenase / diacetyl reductase